MFTWRTPIQMSILHATSVSSKWKLTTCASIFTCVTGRAFTSAHRTATTLPSITMSWKSTATWSTIVAHTGIGLREVAVVALVQVEASVQAATLPAATAETTFSFLQTQLQQLSSTTRQTTTTVFWTTRTATTRRKWWCLQIGLVGSSASSTIATTGTSQGWECCSTFEPNI